MPRSKEGDMASPAEACSFNYEFSRIPVEATPGARVADPLVSVVMITYNHSPFLRTAMDGVLSQRTDFPFEFIVADDASTDGAVDIIREYASNHEEVVPVFQPENSKGFKNMYDALSHVRGRYVAFCEGDDYWTDPCKLQQQVDFLEAHADFNVCAHKVCVIRSDKDDTQQVHYLPKQPFNFEDREEGVLYPHEILANYSLQTSSLVLRWKFTGGLPRDWHVHMGWDHFLTLFHADMSKIMYFDKVMSVWRRNEHSFTWQQNVDIDNFFNENGEYWVDVYEFMDRYFHFRYTELIRPRILLALRSMLRYAYRKGDRKLVNTLVHRYPYYFKQCAVDRLLFLASSELVPYGFFIRPYPQWTYRCREILKKCTRVWRSRSNGAAKAVLRGRLALHLTSLENVVNYKENLQNYDLQEYTGIPRWYMIASSPRTGSTMLSSVLTASGQAGVPLEYFHPDHRADYDLRWGKMNDVQYLRRLQRHRTSPNGMFGVKGHFYQMGKYQELIPADCLFIHIVRRRKVDQAISYFKALNSGQWTANAKAIKSLGEQDYDVQALCGILQFCLNQEEQWRRFFRQRGAQPLQLVYEDLHADPTEQCCRALDFLGLDAVALPQGNKELTVQRDGLSRLYKEMFLEDSARWGIELQREWYA